MKTVSPDGIAFIKSWEGCRLVAYQDAGGVWTVGYGTTHLPNGLPVTPGMTITQDVADQWLALALADLSARVNGVLNTPVTQGEFDAVCSFAYNLGLGALSSSTLLRLLNAGSPVEAALEFPRWCHVGTRVMLGLVRRRLAEATLFLSDLP